MPRLRDTSRDLIDAARDLRQRQTAAEARLWRFLRYGKLGGARVRRQHALGPFVLDFYFPTAQIAIELDGSVHDDEPVAAQDVARSEWIESQGIQVLRFRNEEVFQDIGRVLTKIDEAIRKVG